jgi:2-hydroxyacyl-CoA lyase 1
LLAFQQAQPPNFDIGSRANIEAALNLLERAERPLVLVGKGMAWSRAEDEVRAFIERTQIPFLRSPIGKGVMPDDHPLSVAAARTLALQNADVVFLMGARFNWIFHFGQPPRYAKDMKVIQLDIAPEEIGHNKATTVPLVGDGKAIVGQLNAALAGRQWFHPKDTPWRQMITKKAEENAAMIRPQIHDDEAPANYYRALRNVAAWMPRNAFLSAEGAGTMDIGLTQLPSFNARSCLNAGTYGTMRVGLGQAIAAAVAEPNRPVVHLSGDSAIGFSGVEMETLVRYNFPVKIVVLNQWRHRPRHARDPGQPDVQHEAQRADLRRPLRPDDGSLRRQGLLRRGPEGPARRPRRSNELPRPGAGQRRNLAGLRPQAATVPLAQLTG